MIRVRLFSWALSRIILVVIFTPTIHAQLFNPFLSNEHLNLVDPWSSWIEQGGRADAFPYGYGMFIFFIPAILINRLISFFSVEPSLELFSLLIMSTVVVIEFVLLKVIGAFDGAIRSSWSWLAILSPLAIYITFVHGQIDLLPAAMMTFAAFFVLKNAWLKAGLAVGIAIAAKFSFVLVLPFFIAFFLSKKARQKSGLDFAKGLLPGIALFVTPMIYSSGYMKMVLGTPEVLRTLDAQINVGVSILYLVPIAYLLVFLVFWSLGQISNFILVSFIGSAMLVIALTQTTSVGWFYWGLMLILLSILDASNRTYVLMWVWQLSISTYYLNQSGELRFRFLSVEFEINAANEKIQGFIFTLNLVIGVVLILKTLKDALKAGDIYSLANKPLAINVAGDSGVGKDTLSNEIARLFGDQEVSLLLGDDYHLHERGDTSWLNTSHLSPDANDLEAMGRDYKKLLKRQQILVRHYDHNVGRFTLPRAIKSSQVVIVNGLHSHMIPGAEFADLKIFLSMDENLRIQLKINRDRSQRSQPDDSAIRKSIESRVNHYEQFVEPQKNGSDLHIHLSQLTSEPLRLEVIIWSRDVAFLHDVRAQLNSISNIPAIVSRVEDQIFLRLDPTNFRSQDATAILRNSLVSLDQLFPSEPKFSDGSKGVMSLISVLAAARKRLNNA